MKLAVVFLAVIVYVFDVVGAARERRQSDKVDEVVPVCPSSHDRAFAGGKKCCHYDEYFKTTKNVQPREDEVCPSGDVVDCPSGDDCEDSPPSCFPFFELEGFGPDYNGLYSFSDDDKRYVSGKQIYGRQSDSGSSSKCVWWLRSVRRWNLGPCENVGTEDSFAFIDADVACPYPEEERWKNPETGEYFTDIHNYSADRCKVNPDGSQVCGAGGSPPLDSSATAGVNVIVRNGVLVQKCKWKYSNGRWRCTSN